MSSSSWSRGAGVPLLHGRIRVRTGAAAPKSPKTRPAVPKARLEVSGKVLPGTLVFVSGNSVPVDGSGAFKTEFPYNKDVLKLEITSRSGRQPFLHL